MRAQVCGGLDGLDHLMLTSSVPWLIPPALGDLEAANERNADRPGLHGRIAEKTCQVLDLGHWPAFHKSFVRLAELIQSVAGRPQGPASVSMLSGDVHHSHAARVKWTGESDPPAQAHQLVCSPVNNYAPLFVKPVFTLAWTRPAATLARWWARPRHVPALPLSWANTCGSLFGNTIATLLVDGRGPLDQVGRVRLSPPN